MSGRQPMDARRAWQLRNLGLTFREIGRRLAAESGRQIAYQADAVSRAVERFQVEQDEQGDK